MKEKKQEAKKDSYFESKRSVAGLQLKSCKTYSWLASKEINKIVCDST